MNSMGVGGMGACALEILGLRNKKDKHRPARGTKETFFFM
jgi:hypothetical protein